MPITNANSNTQQLEKTNLTHRLMSYRQLIWAIVFSIGIAWHGYHQAQESSSIESAQSRSKKLQKIERGHAASDIQSTSGQDTCQNQCLAQQVVLQDWLNAGALAAKPIQPLARLSRRYPLVPIDSATQSFHPTNDASRRLINYGLTSC